MFFVDGELPHTFCMEKFSTDEMNGEMKFSNINGLSAGVWLPLVPQNNISPIRECLKMPRPRVFTLIKTSQLPVARFEPIIHL